MLVARTGCRRPFWAYDELAQAKDRVLLDNLQTAMGKRKRSLGVIISTQAADNDHSLSLLIDDGQDRPTTRRWWCISCRRRQMPTRSIRRPSARSIRRSASFSTRPT